jgi:hypothetical protein
MAKDSTRCAEAFLMHPLLIECPINIGGSSVFLQSIFARGGALGHLLSKAPGVVPTASACLAKARLGSCSMQLREALVLFAVRDIQRFVLLFTKPRKKRIPRRADPLRGSRFRAEGVDFAQAGRIG